MREAVEELAETSRKADFMMNAVNPFIRLVNRLGQAAIAVFAGKLLIDGVLSVGVFQAFFQYVYQASEPLTEAAYMINSLQSSIASVERIFQLLDEEEIRPDPRETAETHGEIPIAKVRSKGDAAKEESSLVMCASGIRRISR